MREEEGKGRERRVVKSQSEGVDVEKKTGCRCRTGERELITTKKGRGDEKRGREWRSEKGEERVEEKRERKGRERQ